VAIKYHVHFYSDEDMEVLKRFENGDVINYDNEGPSFYKIRQNYLIRGENTDGTHVEINDKDQTLSVMPTTKITRQGKEALFRYEHPVLTVMVDCKDYVANRLPVTDPMTAAFLLADACLIMTVVISQRP
jgi:hypothetical protein